MKEKCVGQCMSKVKQNQNTNVSPKREKLSGKFLNVSIFVIGIFVFVLLSKNIDVTQDDAYISFRYAANYLSGKGLVYNYGERIEGYTNFLWVITLIISKAVFGIDYLVASKFLGIFFGNLILFLVIFFLKDHFGKVPPVLYLSTIMVLLSNLSFVYWSVSSMETSAFAFAVLLALVMEKRYPILSPAIAAIATLIRPEGVLVFVSILISRLIFKQKNILYYLLMYGILLLPFAVFKVVYYGSLIPNTYFAKSGLGFEYLRSGIEYFWSFIEKPGVYGLIFLPVLVSVKRYWKLHHLQYIYLVIYVIYIIIAGGDVLKAYRFFVPILPVLSFLFVISLYGLVGKIKIRATNLLIFLFVVFYSTMAYLSTYKYIMETRKNEIGLMKSMYFVSHMLKKHFGGNFSVATSTIGLMGYELIGHRLIDILGLTDSYIARNPERIDGIESSWKERKYNSSYLLKQQPDFIVFSTGYKPSAPAERALIMHSEFRKKYTPTGFNYMGSTRVVWRKISSIDLSKDVVHNDARFVNKVVDALNNLYREGLAEKALLDFRESYLRLNEDYPLILTGIGACFLQMNQRDSAVIYLEKALQVDSTYWLAHLNMITYLLGERDTATAKLHLDVLKRHHPWLFDIKYQPIPFP